MFYFLPADITTQVLNFGTPAPIDIQIEGGDLRGNRRVADTILAALQHVPGLVDTRIQQAFDYPNLDIDVDRTKAIQSGFTEREVANSLLNSLSGSFRRRRRCSSSTRRTASVTTSSPRPRKYRVQSLLDLENTPIGTSAGARPEILANVALDPAVGGHGIVVNDYNLRRVIDILRFGAGPRSRRRRPRHPRASSTPTRRASPPRGSFLNVRGPAADDERRSHRGSLVGLGFAIALVYLL